jgi:hypothetical protein
MRWDETTPLDTLVAPLAREARLHLSAFPEGTRACLALTLAQRLVSDANAHCIEFGDDAENAARLLALGAELDLVRQALCVETRYGPGD